MRNLHVDWHTYVMGLSHCHLGEGRVTFVFQGRYVLRQNKACSDKFWHILGYSKVGRHD